MSKTPVHNSFFKEILSREERFRNFFKFFYPELAKEINLQSLKKISDTFVDKELKENFTDIVFSTKFRNKPVQINVLIEHKSTEDKFLKLQLLRYILNIWEHYKKNKKELPVVIPIVIYNGHKNWQPATFTELLNLDNKNFSNFIPEFDFLFLNIKNIPDENISKLVFDAYLYALFIVSKSVHYGVDIFLQRFDNFVKDLFQTMHKQDNIREVLMLSLKYIGSFKTYNKPEIKQKIMATIAEKEDLGFILEELIAQGQKEGIEKGITISVRKMYLKGFSVKEISNILEIEEKEVMRIVEKKS